MNDLIMQNSGELLSPSGEVIEKTLSFITKEEEPVAREYINDLIDIDSKGRVAGYQILLKLYVRPEELVTKTREDGSTYTLYLPDTVRANDRYRACVGLVMQVGPDAYKGERFKDSGPWCKVGDWVVFPRHEGMQFLFEGVAMVVIPDDRIYMVVGEPANVVRD